MTRHHHILLRYATIAVLILPLVPACAAPDSSFDATTTDAASTTAPVSATVLASTTTPALPTDTASTIDVASTTDLPSVTDPYIAFLKQYGWTPQGDPDIRSVTLPPPDAIAAA